MEQRYFYSPFAGEGDQTQVSMTVDPSGIVSYPDGWTPPYQLDLLSDPSALAMDRLRFNSVMYDVTYALQNLQQYGTPEFINQADNQGTKFYYDFGALIRYSDSGAAPFVVYASLATDNNVTPDAAGNEQWAPLKLGLSNEYVAQAQGNGSFTVPPGIYRIFAMAWGGGGAGGSTAGTPSAASGGQPGAYLEGWHTVTPGQVINYSVAIGGAPTPGAYGQAGSGGETVINWGGGDVWTAGGGGGGYGANGGIEATLGAASVATGGTLVVEGSISALPGFEVGSTGWGGFGGAAYQGSVSPTSPGAAGLGSYPGGGGGGGSQGHAGGAGELGLIKFMF